ncbi:MAG: DUF2142 domain-containing protein [Eubacterium sp.]|nr:DUF2142 domain-containing protein [Eubacterium sp.]
MAHFTTKSVKKAIKIALFVIPFLVILIITNGVVSDGHLVDYDDFVTGASVPSFNDYIMEDSHFYVTGDDPYITFYHDAACREFTLFFNEAYDEDLEIPVWFMSNDGEIYDTTTVTWKAGSRFLKVDVPDDRVMLISLGIDRDVSIYHIMSSNPYHTYKWKVFCFFTLTTVLLIIYGLFYKFGYIELFAKKWTKVIRKKYKYYKDRKGAFVKSILVRVVIVFGSIIMSVLLFYILSQMKVRYNNDFIRFNEKTVAFGAILIGYIQFVIVYRRNIAKRFPVFAFFTVLAAGTAMVIAENGSIGISWDDQIHYERAMMLSHCFDAKQHMAEWIMSIAYAWYPWSKGEAQNLIPWFEDLYNGNYFYTLNDYSVSLSKLVYLPMTFGIWVARGLKLSLHNTVNVARWFNVLFLALLTSLASRKLKYGKIVILLIALLPTNIFLASNFSYDTWVTEWVILGYAYLFAEMQEGDDKIGKLARIIIPLSLFIACIEKYIYFVLAIPALFLSSKKFRSKLEKWIYRASIIVAMMLPFVLMYFNNIVHAGVGDIRGGSDVNSSSQLDYIMSNFGTFLRMLLGFLKNWLNPFTMPTKMATTFVDSFAYADCIGVHFIFVILMIVVALISHGDKKGTFPWWYRAGIIVIYVAVGALCAVSMYVVYTPVGYPGIGGCQGRYIIPALFPTLFVLTRIPCKTVIQDKIKEYNLYAIAGSLMFLMIMYGIWKLILCYY